MTCFATKPKQSKRGDPPIRHVRFSLELSLRLMHFNIAVSLYSPPVHDVIDDEHSEDPISFPVWAPIKKTCAWREICATNKPLPAPQKRPQRLQRRLAYPPIPPLRHGSPNLATRSLASASSGPNHMDKIPPAARELSPSSLGQCEPCSFYSLSYLPVCKKPLSACTIESPKSFDACMLDVAV